MKQFNPKCIAFKLVRVHIRQLASVCASFMIGLFLATYVHEGSHALTAMGFGLEIEAIHWDFLAGSVAVRSLSSPLNNVLILLSPYLVTIVVGSICLVLAIKLERPFFLAFPMSWIIVNSSQDQSTVSDLPRAAYYLSFSLSQPLLVVYVIQGALLALYIVSLSILLTFPIHAIKREMAIE